MVATQLPPRRLAGCTYPFWTDYGYVHVGKMCSDTGPCSFHSSSPPGHSNRLINPLNHPAIPNSLPHAPKSLFCVLLIFSWPRICFHLRFCIALCQRCSPIFSFSHPQQGKDGEREWLRKQRAGFGSLEIGKKRCQRRSRATEDARRRTSHSHSQSPAPP